MFELQSAAGRRGQGLSNGAEMTRCEISVAPPNSLVVVMDPSVGVMPEITYGSVWSTPSCVVVGTLMEQDGETRLSLGDEARSEDTDVLLWQGILETANGRIVISTILNETLLQMHVPTDRVHVAVWSNRQAEPSRIDVVVDVGMSAD